MTKVTRGVRWIALAALTALLVTAGAAIGAPTGNGKGLSKEERRAVSDAKAKGQATVVVLIATELGQTNAVVDGLTGLGAKIGYRDNQLGYVRAKVPTDKVDEAAALPGVKALDVDQVVALPDPRPENVADPIAQPAPGVGTPLANPYMPIQDTGAAAFLAVHPTWDGRNVKIGIVDTGVSLDHSSLVTTSTGQPKIVDWVTGTDPIDDGDPTWINMEMQVNGPSFTVGPTTYTAPAAGSFRFGVFSEAALGNGSEYGLVSLGGRGVNRDGDMTDTFPVLWNAGTGQVWVDTNQNNSFADESAMRDYKINRDIGWFGTDNPATAIAERVPFVVQTDGQLKYVNIGIVSGAHGSHVSGIMAGNSLFGGAMSGAAPGAQIVSSRACMFVSGCTAHALFEGMIYVAKQANVDVINMSIGGLPALNDGNNARCELYNRLIEQSKVQMFISIGNSGPGVNTAGDPGVCTDVMGLGAYITSSTYEKDYGTPMPYTDNLHYFSSRGPREDGGFKPDVVAPGAAISSIPVWQVGQPVGGTYTLPPGYAMFNGTSMAAPQATGVGALLVSAAKAAGVQHQPDQLRQAIRSTAQYLTEGGRFKAYDQGNGLINVNAAWAMLSGAQGGVKTVDIESSVETSTLLSPFLATPGVGVGIHDREGISGGMYTRTYTFTRTSGSGGNITYNVSWVGNDGTFSSPGTIVLGKNAPTTMNVVVNPSAGDHSAILNLNDSSSPGIEYQTMNTVIVPDEFNAGNNYSVTKVSTIERGQTKHYFFRVPPGTPALKVDMVGGGLAAGAGAIRFLRWHPWGLGIDSNAASNCYNPNFGGCTTGNPLSRTVLNPQAGVWEVSIDAHRRSDDFPGAPAPFTLTATILGASVSPNPDVIASATIGVPIARNYTLTNLFGAFTGRAVGTNLGSARLGPFDIDHHEVNEYEVTLPAGVSSLRATIGSPSDPAADLDLFVYDCTAGPASCVLRGQAADGDSEESVTITTGLNAGAWKVVVDGFNVPAGNTSYKYIDVFLKAPSFGSISITDANALRATGAVWNVPGSIIANEAPAAGRVLYGNVEVRTDTNILVGSGDVIINSVTP
jgi:Subtilase family